MGSIYYHAFKGMVIDKNNSRALKDPEIDINNSRALKGSEIDRISNSFKLP